jgi:hypothetical protein
MTEVRSVGKKVGRCEGEKVRLNQDRRRKADERVLRTGDGGQMTEDRDQKTEEER